MKKMKHIIFPEIKKVFVLILSVFMLIGMNYTGTIITAKAESLPQTTSYARQAVDEGIVMLKNQDGVLPLNTAKPVSFFGRCQIDTFVCGYGSGKTDFTCTNIMDGIRNNPAISYNKSLFELYNKWHSENPIDEGTWGNWPYYYKEMPVTNEMVSDARAISDVAVVVIGRAAGEERECKLEKGSYYLTDAETDLLSKVNASFEKIVVLLNVGNVIDMAWVDNYRNIKSILYVWQGGKEMGNGVADVLSGDVTPSGKLASTIANSYSCYPSSETFANNDGNVSTEIYSEDIYVGYRYFETFAKNDVKYPFGFGLSYTDFRTDASVSVNNDTVVVTAEVTNTGTKFSGKEVVEVYYSAPQGALGKPARELAAYAKTNEIAPGDSQILTVKFPISSMASYDDSGVTGHDSAWVIEAGNYGIYVGNSVRSAQLAGTYTVADTYVTEQLEEASAPHYAFDRMIAVHDSEGNITEGSEAAPLATNDLAERVIENMPAAMNMTGDKGIKLIDVYRGNNTLNEFVAQLTVEELAAISRGYWEQTVSIVANKRNTGAFGAMLPSLSAKGIPAVSTHDGPAVARFSSVNNSSTTVPIGTMLACTWNDRLVEKLHYGRGLEMVEAGADVLLGPGMNIQRDPLCGRNFEYFSEDPLISGQMAFSVTTGVQSAGASVMPKHYAINNQETNRYYYDSVISERAQREIYLKGFEILVKSAKPYYVMASYNRVNGEYSHYNYDLATTILRNQWGFTGTLVTDWWLRTDSSQELGGVSNNAYRVRAQVDINMPGAGPDVSGGSLVRNDSPLINSYQTWIDAGSPTDSLSGITLGELQRGAKNILGSIQHSVAFRAQNNLTNDYSAGNPVFTVEGLVEESKPSLKDIRIEGMNFNAFDPSITLYHVFSRSTETELPTVVATADNDSTVTIVQATPEAPTAIITVVKNGGKTVYRIIFSDQAGYSPVVDNPLYAYPKNISINGILLPSYYPEIFHYNVDALYDDATVSADVPEGVSFKIIRDPENSIITLRTESDDQALEYVIEFANNQPLYPVSNNFDVDGLNTEIWKVRNQNDKLSVSDGTLNIQTEPGCWKIYYEDTTPDHNIAYQTAEGDWTATVDVIIPDPSAVSNRKSNYFGLYLFDNPDNYVGIDYETQEYTYNQQFINAFSETNGNYSRKPLLGAMENISNRTEPLTIQFRIRKSGSSCTMLYACDYLTDGKFVELASYSSIEYKEPKIGLVGMMGNDCNENSVSSMVKFDNFTVSLASNNLQSDNFANGDLNSSWKIINPSANMTVSNGSVNIMTETGEWYGSNEVNYPVSNVVYQNGEGDWTATMDIIVPNTSVLTGKDTNQYVFTAFDDSNNFIDILYTTATWRSQFIQVRREVAGKQDTGVKAVDLNASNGFGITTENALLQLRIKKTGSTYSMSYRTPTMSEFTVLDTKTGDFSTPKIGFYATHGKGGTTSTSATSNPVQFRNFTVSNYNAPANDSVALEEKTPVTVLPDAETKIYAVRDAWYYSPELVTVSCLDTDTSGYCLSESNAGNYAIFGINVEKTGYYDIKNRIANGESPDMVQQLEHRLELDGNDIAFYSINPTGGWQNWQSTSPQKVFLSAGFHRLRFVWDSKLNLNYIALSMSENTDFGDVNIDGIVDIRDLVRLKKQLSYDPESAVDINLDGKKNAVDLIELRRYLLIF